MPFSSRLEDEIGDLVPVEEEVKMSRIISTSRR